MTISLEKIFFKYILHNKNYVYKVEPNFFKNPTINFVYKVIHKYLSEHTDSEMPRAKQIWEMVALEDKQKNVTKQSFKLLIQEDLAHYDEEKFIKPNLKAWILKEQIKIASDNLIDKLRDIDNGDLNLDIVESAAGSIREMINEKTSSNFDDDDSLGSDFDDAEKHVQDHSTMKVKTGWGALDTMLGGGLDVKTLNILMGQTNSGKSLWMQNIAANAANNGYNVVYFTLEMSEAKVLKRLGSMRLKVPINLYDDKSNDVEFINTKIKNLYSEQKAGDPTGLDDKKLGKINVKFFAAGTANISHFESHLKNLEQKKGFKPDIIIVDYITLMAPIKGLGVEGNLYMKGKHLAEAIRALAAKWNCPGITAMQVAKDAWNASDVTLDKIPESKAIAETADTFLAIIRTEEMQRDNKYVLKMLKQRDGDFSRSLAKFDLNPEFLTIEGGTFP
jgi:replicative DNA helicase